MVNIWYQFMKHYIKLGFFFYFKKIKHYGKENIPKKGAILFVSNHPNALIDPLLIKTGLYKKEKKIIAMIFISSPILFLVGFIISYYFLLPIMLKFFLTFENINSATPIILEARISEYFSLIIIHYFIYDGNV